MSYTLTMIRNGQESTDEADRCNLTYNLKPMLDEAGFVGFYRLGNNLPAIAFGHIVLAALDHMAQKPERYRALNPANGWGDYDRCLQSRLRTWAEHAVETGQDATVHIE